jgi:hypothetical protein
MGWTEFIKYLISGYLLYYGVLVVLDLLKPQNDELLIGGDELLELPEEAPTKVIDENDQVDSHSAYGVGKAKPEDGDQWRLYRENTNVSTGGVSSMTELFKLAQNETIEVKKHLVY